LPYASVAKQKVHDKKFYQEHKEEKKRKAKEYRQEHREELRKYYQEHREELRKYGREYNRKYKEKKRKYEEKYRREHVEALKRYHREYYQKHKEQRKEYDEEYYQEYKEERKKWHREHHKEQRRQVFLLLGGECLLCGLDKEKKLVIHKKDGESHEKAAACLLALKNSDDFVLLCYSCHKGIHWLMKYLKMSWEQLYVLLINIKKEEAYV